MRAPLRILLVDAADDVARQLADALERDGFAPSIVRVDDEPTIALALDRGEFDVVLSDSTLPGFSALRALALIRARQLDLPFVVVSDPIGEHTAVEMMRAGASDYLPRGELVRLPQVMRRELQEATERRERRRAEAALAESERQRAREARLLQQTQRLAGVGGWELDLATTQLFFTEEACRILDASPAEPPTPDTIRARLGAGELERVRAALRAAIEAQAPWDFEIQLHTFAERTIAVRTVGRPVVEGDHVVKLVGALQDVTERRRLEAQLFLTDRLSSMGTIAAGVAHEINNPLTFLTVNLPLALELLATVDEGEGDHDARSLSRELTPLLEDGLAGAQRIAAIARDLKVFSRVDEEIPVSVRLDTVLDSVLRMLENETRHVTRLEVSKRPTPAVRGTTSRLAQLFTNLLVNAMQSLPDRPMVENLLRVTLGEGDEGWVVATIEDNGCGIPEQQLEKIFAPFFTTKPVGVGTGLGLAVCKNIVTGFGGSISVESAVGVGTKFVVRLVSAVAPAKAAGRPRVRKPAQARGRVLVVDDEPAILSLARRLLRGHDLVTAPSVDEALAVIGDEATFDVVLCDLMMPDRPGMDLHEELVRRGSPLADRCCFMTGGAFTPRSRAFIEGLGPDRLLEKPFGVESLGAVMQAALARRGGASRKSGAAG